MEPRKYTKAELEQLPLGTELRDQYGTVWVKFPKHFIADEKKHDYPPNTSMRDLLLVESGAS